MKARLLHEADGQRTYVVILQTGDEAMSQLKAFAERERLTAARLTAIGAFQGTVLGYFDWNEKTYRRNHVAEQVEVASFIGDIALEKGDQVSLHAHVVLGRADGGALAGHLLEGRVRPTLEVMYDRMGFVKPARG